ncbi:hypothetical protein JXA12_03150 [Candidatus Woesearchaeota archaeon]|nr:hypothetical protein [Candidatus Woesearchaeota archaeon]
MVKANSLLELMVFRAEFLKESMPEFENTHNKLITLQKRMQKAYSFIHSNNMIEGKAQIIECSKEYQNIFEDMQKTD